MPDQIGLIDVPEIVASGTFPVMPDWGFAKARNPEVAIHRFQAGNLKREQRFLLGNGVRTWRIQFGYLNPSRLQALRDFWDEVAQGAYGAFTFNAPSDDGLTTTPITCRFADTTLTWERMLDHASRAELLLAEIPDRANPPRYIRSAKLQRFPSAALATALTVQAQEIVPLLRVLPKEAGYPEILVSDRRLILVVEGEDVLYQERLLEWEGIAQAIGGESDQAGFRFGNADQVMSKLANDVDLTRAAVEFSLLHTATGIQIDLWRGEVVNWGYDAGPVFHLEAADGLRELNLPYPVRRISRTCWKDFNDGKNCPAAEQGGVNLNEICDKGFATPLGCLFHNMARFFGAILATPQAVRLKDNSTGRWGFGRSPLTAVSVVAESIYDQVLPEVYCDFHLHPDPVYGYPMNAKIVAGRDESEFYAALGVVSEGPIGAYAQPTEASQTPHLLDGQPPHGWAAKPFNPREGIRYSLGNVPAEDEPFELSQKSEVGSLSYSSGRAAGTAFVEIRRLDEKGIQPENARIAEHKMEVGVRRGLKGYRWTDSGDHSFFLRSELEVLTNPVWIAINMLLRAKGLQNAESVDQLTQFDVVAAASSELAGLKIIGVSDSTPIVVSTELAHNLGDGSVVTINNAGAGADGTWTITNVGPTSFALLGSIGVGGYAGGGVLNGKPIGAALICDEIVDTLVGRGVIDAITVSPIVEDGITTGYQVTMTVPGHGRQKGNLVRIDGVPALGAPGYYLLTAADDDTFTFEVIGQSAALDEFTYDGGGLVDGRETQFTFTGILEEEKPLRDWVTEVLLGCLGYYTSSFGKLRIGIRVNSAARSAFTEGNVIYGSLEMSALKPGFNHLTANFADQEYNFVGNSVVLYDIDHQKQIGGVAPLPLKGQINLPGVSSKSQALRVCQVRLGEELGGKDAAERRYGRQVRFRTTILGLDVEPGMVISLSGMDGLPDYPETLAQPPDPDFQTAVPAYLEMRVERWRLLPDWSIEIEGRTTHNDIYNDVVGPKPADVVAAPIPPEQEGKPANWSFDFGTIGNGHFGIGNLHCRTNSSSVHEFVGEVFYVDEVNEALGVMAAANLNASDTEAAYQGQAPIAGEYLLVDAEILRVIEVTPEDEDTGTFRFERAHLGTVAAAHVRMGPTPILEVNEAWKAELTLAAGLNLLPGDRHGLVHNVGEGEIRATGSYDPATGKFFAERPWPTISAGDTVYADPRIWRLRQKDVVFVLPPRFFRRPDRANFQHVEPLEGAGLVLCRGYLETTNGVRSDAFVVSKIGIPGGHRERTLGGTPFLWQDREMPTGETLDAMEHGRLTESQVWGQAYAEITGGDGGLVAPPAAPIGFALANRVAGGSITLGGAPAQGDSLWITIGSGAEVFVRIPLFSVGSNTSLAAVGEALKDWLNESPHFGAFFYAIHDGAGVIEIVDVAGRGGAIAVEVDGALTATAIGLASVLGVLRGRTYRCTFLAEGGLESELGPPSASTGSTGGASRIEFKNLPQTSDSRVTSVRVYASPDGEQKGPWRLVVEAQAAVGVVDVDDTTEEELADQDEYTGPNQPPDTAARVVRIRRDDVDWIEMRIPPGQARSNVLDGLSMDPCPAGTELSVDLVNEGGPVRLKVVLQ